MADHAVRISRLRTECALLCAPGRSDALGRALSEGLARLLPGAIATELGPDLDRRNAVIRLSNVDLEVNLGDRPDPQALAAALARRIRTLIQEALKGDTPRARVWPDQRAYIASYVMTRLGLGDAPRWAFQSFSTLEHLPAERAAAEVIAADPDLLERLAKSGAEAGGPERLARRLGEPEWTALLARLAEREPTGVSEAALRRALDQAVGAVRAVRSIVDPARPGQSTAMLALTMLTRDDCAETLPTLLTAALIVAHWRLAAAERLRPASPPDGAAPPPRTGPKAPGDGALVRRARADFKRHGLAKRARDAAGVDVMARDPMQSAGSEAGDHGTRSPEGLRSTDKGAQPDAAIATPFAGLGLLIPSLTALSLHHALSPEALAMAVWRTLSHAEAKQAAHDPALARLFPFDPKKLAMADPPTAVPNRLVERLHPEARAGFEAAAPEQPWSALILAEFAGRLPGLRRSSAGYLQTQFLRREGRVSSAGKTLTITLEALPLGVVLQMAGLTGAAMLAPHLGDRSVRLELEKG